MRHPERWRNLGLACLLGGPIAMLVALKLPEGTASGNLRAMLFVLGLMGIIFGAVAAFVCQQSLLATRRVAANVPAPSEPLPPALAATPGRPNRFHGPGDGSDPEDLSKCWDCGFETHQLVAHCPQCGAVMQSRRWSRKLGKMLVVLGVLLSGGMLVALYYELPLLLYPGVQFGDSRFDGSPELALGFLGIFLMVLVFGLTCLGYGIFQVKTGRRSKLPVRIMAGIAGVLMFIAWLLRATGAGAH